VESFLMERTDILELMSTLKLYGMRAAYDEVMTTGIKRRHEPPRIVGELLSAEIAEKQARSIQYQLTIAKLPQAKDIDDFDFTGTPINESLVRDLASGSFLLEQRNAVLVGGTGTGKSHLAIAIARACIRGGARGRFYTVVDLVNRLENKPAPAARTAWPSISPAWTSLFSTSSAISPLLRLAANCCFT
jgi:DNA replication protein DnaC